MLSLVSNTPAVLRLWNNKWELSFRELAMPRASERPNTGCNLERRRDKMIARDTAELIILLKGCSQHWLKGAIGLKPITLGCPLTHQHWILHEQSFPAPSSLPCPGWLAHSLLALDLFTYLLKDANFSCDQNGVYPPCPDILTTGGEERLIMSLYHFLNVWWSFPPPRTTYLRPLKACTHCKILKSGHRNGQRARRAAILSGQKGCREKKRENTEMIKPWLMDKMLKYDSKDYVNVIFINGADIFLLVRNTSLVYIQRVNPGDPSFALQIKWKILRLAGLLSRLLYAARHDLAMAAILSEGILALLVCIYYLLH